jgi:peptidoglycan-associated lipoprotein
MKQSILNLKEITMPRFAITMSHSKVAHKLTLALLFMFALSLLAVIGCGGSKETVQLEPVETEPAPEVSQPEPPTVETQPSEEAAAVLEEESAPPVPLVLSTIYFDFDQYDLRPEALETLAQNGRALKAHPEATVMIEGHCDERGTVEYNLALGDKRAKAARDYLTSLGVNPAQLSTISYGKEQPIDPGHNEEAWAKNRRAEFVRR